MGPITARQIEGELMGLDTKAQEPHYVPHANSSQSFEMRDSQERRYDS